MENGKCFFVVKTNPAEMYALGVHSVSVVVYCTLFHIRNVFLYEQPNVYFSFDLNSLRMCTAKYGLSKY